MEGNDAIVKMVGMPVASGRAVTEPATSFTAA